MQNPDVQFRLDKDLDAWTAGEFKVGTTEDVDKFYSENKGELERFSVQAKKDWGGVSPAFFDEVAKLFKQHPWPKGEYIGFISMFDCNPRFLNNKTFQVCYKHEPGSNFVTAHELLHFYVL